MTDLPNLDAALFVIPEVSRLQTTPKEESLSHPPRILLLYGSLRERSFSRLLSEEAGRLLHAMGCETRTFNPHDLPLADDAPDSHPKVQELRELAVWAEGMVWSSPERHGAMTGIMKTQIDWIPLSSGAVRPTQGKTLAVMQVCGGSQSFNAVNQLRVLGRWMRMLTIPNQSSVAKAFLEFDDAGRMKPSAYYDRVVDVMEELVKFTLLTRHVSPYLVDRYSERKESAEELMKRVNQKAKPMSITIYHNPNCGTSRNVLALIRNSGVEPEVVEYLQTPPGRDKLVELVTQLGMPVHELLRQKDTPYDELQLGNPALSDDALIDAMVAHPILMNRPIVVTPLGTRLCRPSEAVLDILPQAQQGAFSKEDGEKVLGVDGNRI